jgi:hypothetical protein
MYQQAALVLFLGLSAPLMAQTEPKSVPQPVSPGTKEEILVNKDDDRRDLTLLKRLSGNTFLHEAAKTTYAIPDLWFEIRPYRLKRDFESRVSTVLGVERKDRDMVATIYWMPIPLGAKFSDWVRATEVAGEFGEEYETLKVVYGSEKVSKPVKMTYGKFDLIKISVKGGPDRGDKYDGTLFLFEVAGVEGRYIVKVRVSYPKNDRPEVGEKWAEEVLSGFALVQEPKSAPTIPIAPGEEKK